MAGRLPGASASDWRTRGIVAASEFRATVSSTGLRYRTEPRGRPGLRPRCNGERVAFVSCAATPTVTEIPSLGKDGNSSRRGVEWLGSWDSSRMNRFCCGVLGGW